MTCPFFYELFIDRHKLGRLISWVKKASLDCIKQLIEIIERESNHELLLSVKNLQKLGANPFPYIVHVIPRPLLEEFVKGEHFVIVDLLKSISGSSSQAGSAKEPQAEIAQGALVSFTRPNQSPLAIQDPKPTPQATKKKKGKKGKKVG